MNWKIPPPKKKGLKPYPYPNPGIIGTPYPYPMTGGATYDPYDPPPLRREDVDARGADRNDDPPTRPPLRAAMASSTITPPEDAIKAASASPIALD